jgi:hypothetical protein
MEDRLKIKDGVVIGAKNPKGRDKNTIPGNFFFACIQCFFWIVYLFGIVLLLTRHHQSRFPLGQALSKVEDLGIVLAYRKCFISNNRFLFRIGVCNWFILLFVKIIRHVKKGDRRATFYHSDFIQRNISYSLFLF